MTIPTEHTLLRSLLAVSKSIAAKSFIYWIKMDSGLLQLIQTSAKLWQRLYKK
jgi:hypothetical protein